MEDELKFAAGLVFLAVMGFAAYLAHRKGHSPGLYILAFILSVGVPALVALAALSYRCPRCKEKMAKDAAGLPTCASCGMTCRKDLLGYRVHDDPRSPPRRVHPDPSTFVPENPKATWTCASCEHVNPNDTFTCQSCGFSLV
jgi:hypothetical protein